jgi:hypothetical protein
MTRVLTKIRIDEVSAVTAGAGEGVRVLLMKRHDPERSFNAIMAKADADDGGNDGGGGGDQNTGLANHPLAQLAVLLVASGSQPDVPSALYHLLHTSSGAALWHRTHKGVDPMQDTFYAIMKDAGIAATCAAIVAKGSTTISEEAIVDAVTKIAAERFPESSPAQAFAKVYSASTDEARILQKAIAIAKLSVFDVKPIEVGVDDAYTMSELTAAVRASEEIVRIGREKFPFLSAAQQYARIFEDQKYAALAAQAHQRPEPTTIYEMPRSTAPGRTAYTKSDPVPSTDSAYDELTAKAAELRKAKPELTEAQAFSKVFTDPANIELTKRERLESVPR